MTAQSTHQQRQPVEANGANQLLATLLFTTVPQVLAQTKRLELAYWHIKRFDDLRASTAHRAAMVLSANALLVAGATFLLDKVVTNQLQYSVIEKSLLIISIMTTLVLLAFSVYYSMKAIISIKRASRELFKFNIPDRLFINSRDTVRRFHTFDEFRKEFLISDESALLDFALGELFSGVYQYFYRYQMLRNAIKLLFVATTTFLIAILVLASSIIMI